MGRKIGILTAAIAVLAIAVPSSAGASAMQDWETGKLLPVGTQFTAKSNNFIVENGLGIGPIECPEIVTNNQISANTGSTFGAVQWGSDTTAPCYVQGKYMEYTTGIRWSKLSSVSSGSGTISMSFETHFIGTCKFSGEVPFTYVKGSNSIHISSKIATNFETICGPAYIKGDFKLALLNGKPILLT